MTEKIRCGIIGTEHAHAPGKIGTIQKSEDYELIGIFEPNDSLLDQRKRDDAYADIRWLSEEDLLEDTSIEMIAIETHVQQLIHYAQHAIQAGKHIHLDKPAGTSLSQFRSLLDEADEHNLIIQMGYMFRYNDGFVLLRRVLQKGWLGDIHYIHGCINSGLSQEYRSRLSFHTGGMMLELGCHLIDILVLLFGRPNKVTSFLRHDGKNDDCLADNTLAVFEFDNSIATIESSAMEMGARERRTFEVCGKQGSMILQPTEPPAVRLYLSEPHEDYIKGWQSIEVLDIPRYIRDLEELARCIRGVQTFPYTTEHDYLVQETVLRACGIIS
jgi:predicted dehydrogenase